MIARLGLPLELWSHFCMPRFGCQKEKAKRKEERPVESDEYSEAGEEYTEYSEEE